MKAIFVFIIFFSSLAAYSQNINESDIPNAVKNTFKTNYPDVIIVKWELEHGNYEAEFKADNIEKTAIIDKTGNLIALETEISISALPEIIKSTFKNDFPSAKLKEASKIEKAGEINYEAEIKDGNTSWDLVYSENGKLLERNLENSSDDDK